VAELDREIAQTSKEAVIDRVAYTWFNRFTALRYMDVRGYLTPRVVSPAEGETRPEILSQAAQGVIPDHIRKDVAAAVRDLLEGRAPSREPQVEAYRHLVVASCNALHGLMPFLFERIEDYSELLMPNELLADTGWVADLRTVMTAESCEDVEIIGWLYQFYIAEKKQDVFDALKKNVKITAANIPAATQLFTPHWIVRYLVENSLGRLWLLNHPESGLAAKMDYYIAPEEPETDFLRIDTPEDIRICDPACGSGHMLTYAFDLLYEIYLERGYTPRDIPGLILTHNLTGIEIDDRAGGLAAFALMMKAANQLGRRQFLQMEARPDVIVLEDVTLRLSEFNNLLTQLGYDLNVDRLAGGLKTAPLALSGIWSKVSTYLKQAEGPGFEENTENAKTAFASGLADEIGLFDEAANNPFLVNQLKDLRTALVTIADADTKQRDRTALERDFVKQTRSPLIAARVSRIGADYRAHKNNTTYRMELDALLDRVEEAVRHPDALSKLKGIEAQLNEAVAFHAPLWATVRQFAHAKNFGSLIVPKVQDPSAVLDRVRAADLGGDMMLTGTRDRVVTALRMSEGLTPRYHVVVANPPYKKKADLNDDLQAYLEAMFKEGKYDLYQAFILRNLNLSMAAGLVGMITMQGWMFAPRYEAIRTVLLDKSIIRGMAQLGERAFDSIGGEVVSTTAFILGNCVDSDFRGRFVRLTDGENEAEKESDLLAAVQGEAPSLRFSVSSSQFEKIPGNPLIYWAAEKVRNLFSSNQSISEEIVTREGLATGSNETFLREWHEVNKSNVGFGVSNSEDAQASGLRWFPYVKGGGPRRW
jgi:hypothetical protein